jgi:hypothetical protein
MTKCMGSSDEIERYEHKTEREAFKAECSLRHMPVNRMRYSLVQKWHTLRYRRMKLDFSERRPIRYSKELASSNSFPGSKKYRVDFRRQLNVSCR